MPERLTHLDPLGRARMVDVTQKEPSHRRAIAKCRVHMTPETASLIAHEIATAVEKEMEYPGRIKITVIRESRAIEFAK